MGGEGMEGMGGWVGLGWVGNVFLIISHNGTQARVTTAGNGGEGKWVCGCGTATCWLVPHFGSWIRLG